MPAKKYEVGDVKENKYGELFIIESFEEDYIVILKHLKTGEIVKIHKSGLSRNSFGANLTKLYRVGNKFKNNDNEEFVITKIINNQSREIKFTKDGIKKIVSIGSIRTKAISHPLKDRKYGIGSKFKTNQGFFIMIVDIVDDSRRMVEFLDDKRAKKIINISNIDNGRVANPYFKNVEGVGFVGERDDKVKDDIYTVWSGMIRRCYFKNKIKFKSYKNCTVCDEWHNYSNFEKWYEKTFPSVKGVRMDLDKDLMQTEANHKIYSPETCVWLPKKVNAFIVSLFNKRNNSTGYTGVSYKKNLNKFQASVVDFNGKTVYLGAYETAEEAHNAYIIRKNKKIIRIKEYLYSMNYLDKSVIERIKINKQL